LNPEKGSDTKKPYYSDHPTTIIPKCPPATIAFKTPGSPPPNLQTTENIDSHNQKKLKYLQDKPGIKIQVANKLPLAKELYMSCFNHMGKENSMLIRKVIKKINHLQLDYSMAVDNESLVFF